VTNAFFSSQRISQILARMLLSFSCSLSSQEYPATFNILSISSWEPGNAYVQEVKQGLQRELEETIDDFQIYQEHLDARRFTSENTRAAFATYLAHKYQGIQIDAVITISAPAEQFFEQYYPIFVEEKVQVNIAAGSKHIGDLSLDEEASNSHKIFVDHVSSLKHIQAIYPVDRLLIIGDIIDIDGADRFSTFQQQVESSDLGLGLDYQVNQPLNDILNLVSQLPPRTAIYYMGSFKDASGEFATPEVVVENISARANAPVFSHWDFNGENILGGYQISWERIGVYIGNLISSYITNEPPKLDSQSIFEFNYNWNQLDRWGIELSAISPDANIYNKPPSFFEHYRLHLMLSVVGIVIIYVILLLAYRNNLIGRRNAILSELAQIDGLTSLLNRRAIMPLLKDAMRRREQFNHTASILLLDLDRFKTINDQYGHMIGDDVLTKVGEQLKSHVRSGDRVCRWGGEEFLVLASDTGLLQAQLLGEKLRTAFESLELDEVVRISISVGVAEYKPHEGFPKWYERADRALYEAKAKGRNKVIGFAA
jgi:diguanylate cyclase (GGDEF)-like protein